jgi:hypothetical protein
MVELTSAIVGLTQVAQALLAVAMTSLMPRPAAENSSCPAAIRRPYTQMACDAIEAADDQWRTSIDLAGRAGWSYCGHWRSLVCRLVKDGYLERSTRNRKLLRATGKSLENLSSCKV